MGQHPGVSEVPNLNWTDIQSVSERLPRSMLNRLSADGTDSAQSFIRALSSSIRHLSCHLSCLMQHISCTRLVLYISFFLRLRCSTSINHFFYQLFFSFWMGPLVL